MVFICRIIVFLFYKLYNYILEPLHDLFSIPIVYYESLINIIKYIYSFYFFNKFFHKFKIGLEKNNDNNYILVFNSINYYNYNNYFLIKIKNNNNFYLEVLKYSFINNININLTSEKEIDNILKKIEDIYENKKFNKKQFDKFLENYYMYYF